MYLSWQLMKSFYPNKQTFFSANSFKQFQCIVNLSVLETKPGSDWHHNSHRSNIIKDTENMHFYFSSTLDMYNTMTITAEYNSI